MRHIHVTAETSASPAAVFALLTDGSTWPAWSPIESVELEKEGIPPPEGVGAIRRNRRGRVTGRDEIVEIVPGRRFAYRSLSGLPVRDYQAAVELSETNGETRIDWRSSFAPKVPGTGWLMERGLRKFLQDCASGLAAEAAKPAR
jgi:Polyketide cyclase / dehydrase and lipid transport